MTASASVSYSLSYLFMPQKKISFHLREKGDGIIPKASRRRLEGISKACGNMGWLGLFYEGFFIVYEEFFIVLVSCQ